MNKSQKIFEQIKRSKLTVLLTPKNVEQWLTAYETLTPLDISLEIALRSDVALDGIKSVMKKYPEALIFAGTVMTRSQAERAIEAGVAGVLSLQIISLQLSKPASEQMSCASRADWPMLENNSSKKLSSTAVNY